MSVRVFSAPWVLVGRPGGDERTRETPDGIRDGAVALDGDTVLAAGPRAEVEARFGRGEVLDAILLPALVNAHLHLELSHMAGRVQGGEGLAPWVQLFIATRAAARVEEVVPAMELAAEDLMAAGVAAVGDVTNTLGSVGALAKAGVAGSVYLEVLGLTPERFERVLATAREALAQARIPPGLRVRLSPHAVYSTLPDAVAALLDAGPASIHLAEDPDERALVAHGTGAFARLAASMRAPPPRPRARSAVAAVAPHLGAGHLAVHCVDVDAEDAALLARSGATAVLCPRSNRHIGGTLPPLSLLLEAGVPLAVGTDSLASSPSLAPLAELAVLREAFPTVPASRLLPLAWNGAAVGAPHVGRLAAGKAPGVLAAALGGARPADPFEHLLARFGVARPPPFRWLARQRPEAIA